MKRQIMQDERVSSQHRKIHSEAYGILMIVLIVSIIIQQFLLKAPFEQYAAEFICFFAITIYIIIRYMMLGLNLFGEGKQAKKITIVNSIIPVIIVTAVNGVLNYKQYAEHYQEVGIGYFIAMLVITFISASIGVSFVMLIIGYVNKKIQAKIQKQLDKEEQDDDEYQFHD